MRSRLAILSVAALVVFAGCGGLDAPGTTSPQTSPGTTPPTTTVSQTATPGTTTIAAGAIRDYQALSNASRSYARTAIEDGQVTAPRENFSGDLAPGMEWSHLRYEGAVYELSWERGMVAKYKLARVPRVNASEVENASDVVADSNLTTRAEQLFTAVRSGNQSRWFESGAFPDQFRSNLFVKQQGAYYRIVVYTADVEVFRLSATQVAK